MVTKTLLATILLLSFFNIKKIETNTLVNKITCDSHQDQNEPKPEEETENKIKNETDKNIELDLVDFLTNSQKLNAQPFEFKNIYFSQYLRKLPIKPPIV